MAGVDGMMLQAERLDKELKAARLAADKAQSRASSLEVELKKGELHARDRGRRTHTGGLQEQIVA
jgi:hypothetical protein